MTMPGGGGGSIEVGAVSFRIGVDLSAFQRDLSQAEQLARQRASAIQQHFNALAMGTTNVAQAQMGHGPMARRAVEQAAAGQLGLPGFDKAGQLFQQRLADVRAQAKQYQQELSKIQTEVAPSQAPPPPEPPAPVEHVRRVTTRDYHTTERGGGPEAVSPPTPVSQKREVETRDVRTSIAPQPVPPPPAPVKVNVQPQVVGIPGPPPNPPFPLTAVETAGGQPAHVPSRMSGPRQTQRQIPPTISGVSPATRPVTGLPTPPPPPPVEPRAGVPLAPPATPTGLVVVPPISTPAPGTKPDMPAAVPTPAASNAAASQLGAAAQQLGQAVTSLKGEFVRWTGAAGARMEGRVTSEKGGMLRVNVGGNTVSVPREQVETPFAEASPAPAPTVTPKARKPRTPKPAETVSQPVAEQEEAAPAAEEAAPPEAAPVAAPARRGRPRKPPLVMPAPPALPRSGQPPRVYLEPPEEGAATQQAYVMAPTGIYRSEVPTGLRKAQSEQIALGQYFSGAEKVGAKEFPPYARYLAAQEAEKQRQAAARVTGATPPTAAPPPAAPVPPRAPTARPGEVQALPPESTPPPQAPAPPPPVLGPDELLPPVAPLEIRPLEGEASVIQRPRPPAIEPTRTYGFQASRSIYSEITTGPRPSLEQQQEGERPARRPISRAEAAQRLWAARRRARESEIATAPERLERGGRAHANRVHLIGERGPELFIPDRPGYVLSNERTRDLIARFGGGDIQALVGGGPTLPGFEPGKPQLPAFGTVLKKPRRRAQQPSSFDVSQPDLFGGAGKERGEGATRAEQLSFAREEMRDTGSPSLFEAIEQQPKLLAAGGKVTASYAIAQTTARLETTGLVPAAEVGQRLLGGPQPLPAYLRPAQTFMGEQSARLARGALTPKEVGAAYLTTLSSIHGQEISRAKAEEKAGDLDLSGALSSVRGRSVVRPEDAFAQWLTTAGGQEALADVSAGRADQVREAIYAARMQQMGGFGFPSFYPKKKSTEAAPLFRVPKPDRFNLQNLDEATKALNAAGLSGEVGAVERVARQFEGIGAGKTGFLASWLGSSRLPTLDVNALKTWLGDDGGKLAEKAMGSIRGQRTVGPELQQAVIQRHKEMQSLGYLQGIPADQLPGLMHWTLFDAAKLAQTTHHPIFEAMRVARRQAGGPVTPPTQEQFLAALRKQGGVKPVSFEEFAGRRPEHSHFFIEPSGAILGSQRYHHDVTEAAFGSLGIEEDAYSYEPLNAALRLGNLVRVFRPGQTGRPDVMLGESRAGPTKPTAAQMDVLRRMDEEAPFEMAFGVQGGQHGYGFSQFKRALDWAEQRYAGRTAEPIFREARGQPAREAVAEGDSPELHTLRRALEKIFRNTGVPVAELSRSLGATEAEIGALTRPQQRAPASQLETLQRLSKAFQPAFRKPIPRAAGGAVNPYLLHEAPGPGLERVSDESFRSHRESILARHAEAQREIEELQGQLQALKGAEQMGGIQRPPWSAGVTNDDLRIIAREHNANAEQPGWWETVGLHVGSDEVRAAIAEFRGKGGASSGRGTAAGARKQLADLRAEHKKLTAAVQQLRGYTGQQWYRPTAESEELPFGDAPIAETAPVVDDTPSWMRRAREATPELLHLQAGEAPAERPARAPRTRPARAPRAAAPVESYFRNIEALSPQEIAELTAGTELEGKLRSGIPSPLPVAASPQLTAQQEASWKPAPAGEMPEWMRRTLIARYGEGAVPPRAAPAVAAAPPPAGRRQLALPPPRFGVPMGGPGPVAGVARPAARAQLALPAAGRASWVYEEPPPDRPFEDPTIAKLVQQWMDEDRARGGFSPEPPAVSIIDPLAEMAALAAQRAASTVVAAPVGPMRPAGVPFQIATTPGAAPAAPAGRSIADIEHDLENLNIRIGKRNAQIQGGKAGVQVTDPDRLKTLREQQTADRRRRSQLQDELEAAERGVGRAATGHAEAPPPVGAPPSLAPVVTPPPPAAAAAPAAPVIPPPAAAPVSVPAAAAPAAARSPEIQHALDTLDRYIAETGTPNSPQAARLLGDYRMARIALQQGAAIEDLPHLLRAMGLKPKQAQSLADRLSLRQPVPATAAPEAARRLMPEDEGYIPPFAGGSAAIEEQRQRDKELLARLGPLPPQPPVPPRPQVSAPGGAGSAEYQQARQQHQQALRNLQAVQAVTSPAALVGKAQAVEEAQAAVERTRAVAEHLSPAGQAAEAQLVTQHLATRRANLTQAERLAESFLLGGSSLAQLAGHLQLVGVGPQESTALIEKLRASAAGPQPVAARAPAGGGFMGRLLRSFGLGREQGGSTGPQAYLVGEAGPEIFVPHAAGYVLAHDQARRAISEGQLSGLQHRQGGGGVTPQNITDYIQQLPQRDMAHNLVLGMLQQNVPLSQLADRLSANPQQSGLNAAAARRFVQDLLQNAHPALGPLGAAITARVGLTAQAGAVAAAGPPAGTAPAQQVAVQQQLTTQYRQNFETLQRLTQGYLQATGASRQYAEANSRQVAIDRLVQQRTQELVASHTALTGSRRAGLAAAEAQARAETQLLEVHETEQRRRGGGGGGLRFLGQTPTQFIREVGALAGINLGLNVMTGLAREVHDIIANTVGETVRLAAATTQVGVAYGQVRGGAISAGFQQFQAAPLTAETQASYQQTAAALAPVADQFQLTTGQVQQLTTASAQLATIWGGDQVQAADALQGVLRGNAEAASRYNINLVDQYGRIRDLSVSYQELASAIGPAAAAQEMFALEQQRVTEQVDAYNASATEQERQVNDLRRNWASFQTTLAQTSSGPVTAIITELNGLLRETNNILGGGRAPTSTGTRAAGGPTTAPGAYLVGEKGPELFVPNSSGYVYSNAQTQRILGARQEGGQVGFGDVLDAAGRLITSPGIGGTAARLALAGPLALGPGAAAFALAPKIAEAEQHPLVRAGTGALIGAGIVGAALAASPVTAGTSLAGVPVGAGIIGTSLAAGAGVGAFGGLMAPDVAQGLGNLVGPPTAAVVGGGAGLASSALQEVSTGLTQLDTNIRQVADTLPEPLRTLGQAAAAGGDAIAGATKAVSDAAAEVAKNPPGAPAQYVFGRGGNIPMPDDAAARRKADQDERSLRARQRTSQVDAASLQQSQAKNRVDEANARLQQLQAQSELRRYDAARANIVLDGQRVSAQRALDTFAMRRLQLESEIAPVQLEQERIQNRIAIITQPNLQTRQQNLQAQFAALAPTAQVSAFDFQQRQAQLRIRAGFLEAAAGEQPKYNVQAEMGRIYQLATSPRRAEAELAAAEKQQDVAQTGFAVQADQLQKAMAAIPFEEQQQANERTLLLYQEQIHAADASSAAVTRVLEMADLIASPDRIAAAKDLNEATVQAAQAAQTIAQNLIDKAANPQATGPIQTQPVAEVPAAAQPTAVVSTQPTQAPTMQPAAPPPPAPPPPPPAPPPPAPPAPEPPPPAPVLTPATGNMQPRQHGGPVGGGSQYLVGEAGPELFAPLLASAAGNGNGDDVSGLMGGGSTASPSGNVSVSLNMGNVTINNGTDLDAFQQSVIDAATRGTLQALRYGRMVTPMRVPASIAGGRGY